jgi:hypothetical protein
MMEQSNISNNPKYEVKDYIKELLGLDYDVMINEEAQEVSVEAETSNEASEIENVTEEAVLEATNEIVEDEVVVELESQEEELEEDLTDLDSLEELEEEIEDEEVNSEELDNQEVSVFASIERKPYKPFVNRIADASEQTQEFYNTIKNELLSFRKIKARISKKSESFRLGRVLQAKLVMSGSTLKLYLSLDPNEFDNKVYFHKDMSHKKAYQQVPLLMRLRSKRSVKKSLDLINQLMTKNEVLKKNNFTETNYIQLIKESLANNEE